MALQTYKLKLVRNFIQGGTRVKHYSYKECSIMLTEPDDYSKIPEFYDTGDDRWLRVASFSWQKGHAFSEEDILVTLAFLGFDLNRAVLHETGSAFHHPKCDVTQFYRQTITATGPKLTTSSYRFS